MITLMRSVLLLFALWLSGCEYVRITNPIADGNTPIDERLIGTWVFVGFDEFAVLNIQKKGKNTNELAVIMLGEDGSCDVIEGREVQLSDYWIFESEVDRGGYSCVGPHENPESGEVKGEDTLKELGNRYEHVAYKILKRNDPAIVNLLGQDDESISEAIEATIKYYKLGEAPSVLVVSMLKPELFAQQIKAGKMKGSIQGERANYSLDRVWCANRTTWWASLSKSSCVESGGTVYNSKLEAQESIKGASDWSAGLTIMENLKVTVTDSPEVVRAYLSDLDFFEDMDPSFLLIRVRDKN